MLSINGCGSNSTSGSVVSDEETDTNTLTATSSLNYPIVDYSRSADTTSSAAINPLFNTTSLLKVLKVIY